MDEQRKLLLTKILGMDDVPQASLDISKSRAQIEQKLTDARIGMDRCGWPQEQIDEYVCHWRKTFESELQELQRAQEQASTPPPKTDTE